MQKAEKGPLEPKMQHIAACILTFMQLLNEAVLTLSRIIEKALRLIEGQHPPSAAAAASGPRRSAGSNAAAASAVLSASAKIDLAISPDT